MQGVLVDKLPQNVKEGKIIPICCTEESKKDASLKDAHSTFYYDDENNYYQPFGAGIYAKSTLPKLIEHYSRLEFCFQLFFSKQFSVPREKFCLFFLLCANVAQQT